MAEPGIFGRDRDLARRAGIQSGLARKERALRRQEQYELYAQIEWPPIEGDICDYIDRVWTPAIVQTWQDALNEARHSRDPAVMLRVLIPMTAMCPQFVAIKQRAASPPPSDVPLSSSENMDHLSDEELSRITGRQPSESIRMGPRAVPKREKAA